MRAPTRRSGRLPHRYDVSPSLELVSDDSCEHAQDGYCQDPDGDHLVTDGDGEEVALCGRGTDETDCGARVAIYGDLSYGSTPNPPIAPPPPGHPPPSPPPPPATFDPCTDTCTNFVRPDGPQVPRECVPTAALRIHHCREYVCVRLRDAVRRVARGPIRTKSPPTGRWPPRRRVPGQWAAPGDLTAAGYGLDADCGPRIVGGMPASRRLQELGGCECSCYVNDEPLDELQLLSYATHVQENTALYLLHPLRVRGAQQENVTSGGGRPCRLAAPCGKNGRGGHRRVHQRPRL